MEKGTIIKFDRIKQFINIGPLGFGGTGDTYLFKDETTDMLFAFKKYSPKDERYIEQNYLRFVEEIKILFNISHPNIVRIYNYYLYPDKNIGYLQMEYIDGVSISEFEPKKYSKEWEDIFKEVIETFKYLEQKNILHRDIRPENIMISRNGDVKVIDFGFGKKLEKQEIEGRSVLLNWPVTQLPEEVILRGIYNHQSEIYFIGKLFESYLNEAYATFKFKHIIEKMVKLNPDERHKTFSNVSSEISQGVIGEIDFTDDQKNIYRVFADYLATVLKKHLSSYEFTDNIKQIISDLDDVIRTNALEEHIQGNEDLIRCFIKNGFNYNTKFMISTEAVIEFYRLLTSLDSFRQKIIIDNINMKLSKIKIEYDDEILPF